MTLTRTQMHERATSLSGELKAAREAQSECVKALQDQERLVTIAAKAVERADARVEELLAERAQLAADMANAILQVGEAPLADEAAPGVEVEMPLPVQIANGVFQAEIEGAHAFQLETQYQHAANRFPNAIFNGVDRAFDEATQP